MKNGPKLHKWRRISSFPKVVHFKIKSPISEVAALEEPVLNTDGAVQMINVESTLNNTIQSAYLDCQN